jgi:hypothetical protein
VRCLGTGEVTRLAAGHDRQRPVLCLRRRAGDRGVEHAQATLGQLRADRARLRRRDRRHVDAQHARRCAHSDALLPDQHLANLVAVDDHADHDVAGGAHGGWGVGDGAAVLGDPALRGAARTVEDRQLVARAREVGCHPRAHDPESHEAGALGCRG